MNTQTADVYISYSRKDEPWVLNTLRQRLTAKGVKFTDRYSFSGGLPEVDEMMRYIRESRRTLLVLSPDYLEDTWGQYSNVFVGSYGMKTGRWLAVPIMVVECDSGKIPERLSFLTIIDMSSGREEAWDQLFNTLAAPPDFNTEDYADLTAVGVAQGMSHPIITKGFDALRELMQRPDVKAAVAKFQKEFRESSEQIKLITDFKLMHDELHIMQKETFEPLESVLEMFPVSEGSRNVVLSAVLSLEENSIPSIKGLLVKSAFSNRRQPWIDYLTQALADLTTAKDTRDREALSSAVWNISEVVGKQPSRINEWLVEAARQLAYGQLIHPLTDVRGQIVGSDVDPGKVKLFEDAIINLADLYHRLMALIDEHDMWQIVDGEVRAIKSQYDLTNLRRHWQFLRKQSESVYESQGEDWALKFRATCAALDVAVTAGDFEAVKEPFRQFCGYASVRFIKVDKALKTLCGTLCHVGDSLSFVLEVLQ